MGEQQEQGPVVVGVDRSDTARLAADRAVQLATALGAPLHVVMAVERSHSKVVRVGSDEFPVDHYADAEAYLRTLRLQLGQDEVTTELGDTPAGKTLCEIAERVGAQAIVVGNRHVQGASRVLGSVAIDVLRHAPCDVVVVNTADG